MRFGTGRTLPLASMGGAAIALAVLFTTLVTATLALWLWSQYRFAAIALGLPF
ncbi:MAG: hypothetical protein AAF355_15370 [Myxococcota bacterium]